MLYANQYIVNYAVRAFSERMISIDARLIKVAAERIGRLVRIPERKLGIAQKNVPVTAGDILKSVVAQAHLEGQVVGVPIGPGVQRDAGGDIILFENTQHRLLGRGRWAAGKKAHQKQYQEKYAQFHYVVKISNFEAHF